MNFVGAWKVISLILTGAFGVLGLIKEFKSKETNRITKWGWVSLVGIVLSAGFGVIAQLKQLSAEEKSRQATAIQTLALAKRTDQAVQDIQRALSPLDEPRFILNLKVPCDLPKYQSFCLATKAASKKKSEGPAPPYAWDKWPGNEGGELTFIVRFFVDPQNVQQFIDARYVSYFHEPMLPDLQMFIHGSAKDKSMGVIRIPVQPFEANDEETIILLEHVSEPTTTRSNGRIKSVLDLPNTTVVITDTDALPSESGLSELILHRFYIKLKSGHEIHVNISKVERITVRGRPAYKYVFPATPE